MLYGVDFAKMLQRYGIVAVQRPHILTCPSSALFLGKLRICLVIWSHLVCVSSQA